MRDQRVRDQRVADSGRELADLRRHWGEAYEITFSQGQFHAARRDDGAAVHASAAQELMRRLADAPDCPESAEPKR
jgi:hypothetical protein